MKYKNYKNSLSPITENRGISNKNNSTNSQKISIKKRKDNTLHSLQEVEYFLCNIKKIFKSIKLYKLLK